MLNRFLDEGTSLMVVLLVLAMIVSLAVAKWAVIVAALIKFFTL